MEEEAYLHTYPHAPLPQGSLVLDDAWANSWPVDILPDHPNRQVRGEAGPLFYQSFPLTRRSNSMCQTAFPWFTPSALPGSEGFRAALDKDPPATLEDVDATHNSREGQNQVSINAYSNQCRPYSPASIDTRPILPALPTFPYEKSKERPATASSRSYRRLAGIRGASKGPYSCNICGKVYAQPQGITRHHREVHRVSVCMYCGEFKWGRLYQFKKHLKAKHPNVDHIMLGGPTGSRRKVTRIRKQAPQQRFSSSILEHDRGGHAEHGVYPPAPPTS